MRLLIFMEQLQENKMGTAPLFRLICSMSLPAMFSMLIQSLYNVVDSYFVAKISEEALTAVSLAQPVQMLMISVACGTGVGINSLISRRLGEGRFGEADHAATHGLILGLFNWLVFALLGMFGTQAFFSATTSNSQIHEMGATYTYIVTICSIGIFVELNVERILQATGNMIYPMVFQLIGAVTNIILDPVLIFGLGGMPKMGIAGAAAATVIGQILAMVVSLLVLFTKDHRVHITLLGFRLRWKTVKDIYVVGLPSMVMQAIGSVLTLIMNLILGNFSDTAIAVYGVYSKLQSFVFMPVFGLNNGLMPIIGYNYGAGNKKRLMSTMKIGAAIAFVIMLVGTVIFWLFPNELLSIFSASGNMLEIGVPALRLISLCFPAAALGIIASTVFQAVGLGGRSLTVSVLRQLVILVPAAYLLSKAGLFYVWFAFPIAEVVSLLASILLLLGVYRSRIANLVPVADRERE